MRWGLVCVLVLAVVAGCNAFGAGSPGTASPTVTPAPVPSPSPTAGPATPAVAPGVETTGIADLGALVDAHVRAARNESWAWTENSTITQTYGNVTINTSRNQSIRYVDERTYHRVASLMSIRRGQQLQFLQDYEQFADGETGFETWYSPEQNEVVYSRDESPAVDGDFAGFSTGSIRDFLDLESATVSRVDVGDRQHYLIVGTRSTVPEYGPVTTYQARAIVREDGFVTRLNVSYTVEQPDLTVVGRYTFAYRPLENESIEQPDWVDTARERTGD